MTQQTTTKSKRRFAREPQAAASSASEAAGEAVPPAPPESKIAKVIALLERAEGATLDELVKATGWQPHTTRAAMTGLKKKGHTIERGKRDDVTCYRITKSA